MKYFLILILIISGIKLNNAKYQYSNKYDFDYLFLLFPELLTSDNYKMFRDSFGYIDFLIRVLKIGDIIEDKSMSVDEKKREIRKIIIGLASSYAGGAALIRLATSIFGFGIVSQGDFVLNFFGGKLGEMITDAILDRIYNGKY